MEPTDIPTVVACDVGNSAIHIAAVTGESVTDTQSLPHDAAAVAAEITALWEQAPDPKTIAACSVCPEGLTILESVARAATGRDVLVVGRELPLPIQTALPAPEAAGTDRLCAAVAAFDRLGAACVVADFGTAITIDYVDESGVFQGGAILPGLATAARSLKSGTAQLPEIRIDSAEAVIGTDTHSAIVTGLLASARGAMRHLVEAYATAWGHWPLVIATGRDASLICGSIEESDLVQAIVPDLVLRGVAMAYYKSLTLKQ